MTEDQPTAVEAQRADFVELITRPLPADAVVHERTLGGRPALVVSGESPDAGLLLYFHGGGYVLGSPSTHLALTWELARRAGLQAVSPDYRLAPEHPFPAAVDDALAAYRELLAEGEPAERIVLAGDSAGGGLAVATLVAAREAGLPQPAAVVVLSPWVDLTVSGSSATELEGVDPIFVKADLDAYVRRYLGDGDAGTPLASPLFARLTGLPPLLIQVGAHELLLDDAVRLAGRAAADGVEVALRVWPGAPHVFQHLSGQRADADEALDEAGAFLARHVGGYLSVG